MGRNSLMTSANIACILPIDEEVSGEELVEDDRRHKPH